MSFATIFAVLAAIGGKTVSVESTIAYEIAVRAAIEALPDELRPFFESHSALLLDGARSPLSRDGVSHACFLDSESKSPDPADRRAEAKRTAETLIAGFAAGTPNANDDSLPAQIARRVTSLEDSLKNRSEKDIAESAGTLIHFCMDAALPFNATDPKWTEQPRRLLAERDISHSPRTLFHDVVNQRLADRLAVECRVAPMRVKPVASVPAEVIAVVSDAHEAALELERVKREWTTESEVKSRDASGVSKTESEKKLAERGAPILETQIEAGALLAANLIVAAWTDAGRPPLSTQATAPATAKAGPSPPDAGAPFIGS